jgi:hypothetical protein
MSTSAPTVTSEVVAEHFRRIAQFRANHYGMEDNHYSSMEIEVVSESELRITGSSASKAELAMDQVASELSIEVECHWGDSQTVLVLWKAA